MSMAKMLWQRCYGKSPGSPPQCTGVNWWWHSLPISRVCSFVFAGNTWHSLQPGLQSQGRKSDPVALKEADLCLFITQYLRDPPEHFFTPPRLPWKNRMAVPTYQVVWGVSRTPFGNMLAESQAGTCSVNAGWVWIFNCFWNCPSLVALPFFVEWA